MSLSSRIGLKEAELQNSVLTNRNRIRGIYAWVSKQPNEYKWCIYVDTTGIGGKKMPFLGRSIRPRVGQVEKSAEVIVVAGNELIAKSVVSQATKDRT
jgi:hypothetical protein